MTVSWSTSRSNRLHLNYFFVLSGLPVGRLVRPRDRANSPVRRHHGAVRRRGRCGPAGPSRLSLPRLCIFLLHEPDYDWVRAPGARLVPRAARRRRGALVLLSLHSRRHGVNHHVLQCHIQRLAACAQTCSQKLEP